MSIGKYLYCFLVCLWVSIIFTVIQKDTWDVCFECSHFHVCWLRLWVPDELQFVNAAIASCFLLIIFSFVCRRLPKYLHFFEFISFDFILFTLHLIDKTWQFLSLCFCRMFFLMVLIWVYYLGSSWCCLHIIGWWADFEQYVWSGHWKYVW